MFGFLKKKGIVIGAPIEGEAVSIKEVSDPTFGEEILGTGVAIKPTVGKVVAPADATIELMFDTGHAVSLHTDSGVDLLIHVGLDTVALKGEHFKIHCASGDKVKAGDLLIEFDPIAIAAAGYDTIAPVVICNTPDYKSFDFASGNVKPLDKLAELFK